MHYTRSCTIQGHALYKVISYVSNLRELGVYTTRLFTNTSLLTTNTGYPLHLHVLKSIIIMNVLITCGRIVCLTTKTNESTTGADASVEALKLYHMKLTLALIQ